MSDELKMTKEELIDISKLTRDLAAAREDAELWRACLYFGFPVRNQTASGIGVRWTIDGKWFGHSPQAALESAIDAARGKG